MINPLEAVTQAVNSLLTALKLPDESARADEVLGEMSFPQFSRLLPYRDYNQESGLFMNDITMGFMLEAIPINGANESIVEALDQYAAHQTAARYSVVYPSDVQSAGW
ncbi:TraC family protein [Escherichia coli]